MSTDLQTRVPLQAARALANHLRENPGDASLSAAELGMRFDLAPEFVQEVLNGIRVPDRPRPKQETAEGALSKIGKVLLRILDKLTSEPMAFAGVTTFIGAGSLAILLSSIGPGVLGRSPGLIAAILLTALFTVLSQFGVYARHGRGRYAVYGGGFVFVGLLATIYVPFFVRGPGKMDSTETTTFYIYTISAAILFSLMYIGVGALFALAGGLWVVKRSAKEIEEMSRQDLLERYYELQSRLSHYPREGAAGSGLLESAPVREFRRRPILYSFLLSIPISLAHVVSVGALTPGMRTWGTQPPPVALAVNTVFTLIVVIAMVLAAFLAKRFWMAVASTIAFSVASAASQALPIGIFGPQYFAANYTPTIVVAGILQTLMIALGGWAGAIIEEKALKDRRLMQNDPAVVLAEMVRIQWRLSTGATNICVMVVDAAKSSEMKMNADPLDVEYSFREYQEWIEAISAGFGGRVHSTAGDGAVVYFTSAESAFQAARAIQTDVGRFNGEVNRLARPFRLRIGLHMGPVAGDLDKIQFTDVIDIAAHVEQTCTVGGIAVTEPVAQAVAYDHFIPLREPVDTFNVMLAANPTVE